MRRNYSIGKRLLALVLSIAMLAVYLPNFAVRANASQIVGKVADYATMDGWMQYFGPDKLSTEYAGAVWTDKSVFTDDSAFPVDVELENTNSFLVALSAIAASKQVEGQSMAPIDTMLVLDLSNSMDTLRAVPDMLNAANASIAKLLGMNSYNRVGVVLYSGNSRQGNSAASTATVILPLGRYRANSSGEYLDYTGNTSNTTVIRANGMTYENGTAVTGTGSKQTDGATYIQNGLYKAWQEFEQVEDTTVTSGTLAGIKRTPVYILMSDGEPTAATTSYNNVGQSGVGNGTTPSNQNTRNQLTFLTQLTASWVKGKAEAKYGSDAKFYTLGLGIDANESATAVLSPASTNTTVAGWWTNFMAGTAEQNVAIANNWSIYRDAAVVERNYVDMFKSADEASELPGIFDEIVQAIEEVAYGVTLVSGTDKNMDGYITFEDEIGELMQVRHVEGLLLGDVLFTGAQLAERMGEGDLGTTANPRPLGDELVATVRERIGIADTSVAQQLIASAYQAGQLSYNTETGEYSNYIGWYAGANGEYLGFWQESYGMTMEGAPAGAKYINKSYGYLGEQGGSDLMHVVVQVGTNIQTSHQRVTFKIPAALIPTVVYEVQLNGTSMDSPATLTRTGAEPMRLLLEVGLREDINAVNIEEKVAEYLAEDPTHHIHKDQNGNYIFYSNNWGDGNEDHTPEYNEELMEFVAESHFHPSYQNERYYHTEDTAIYTYNGTGYVLYTGSQQPAGTGYFQCRKVITAQTNGGQATIENVFVPVAAQTLANSDNLLNVGDNWYIKKGVVYYDVTDYAIGKDSNLTNTLQYAEYPVIIHDEQGYNIYSILGNNGRITLTPATGIKLSKVVTETSQEENAPTTFEFVVTFDAQIDAEDIVLTDANKEAFTGTYTIANQDGKTVVTVLLADGEEVYITGIPAGTAYEVYETQTAYYASDKTDDKVTGTVTANTIEQIVFSNAPRLYGKLTVTKTVNHPFGETPAALDNIVFTFQVDLGADAAGKSFPLADGTMTPAADENGVITMTIKAGQVITIQGLLEGTPYVVREINIPNGFRFNETASSGLSGNVNGAAHLVNDYVITDPVTNPDLDIVLNKGLTGDYTQNETFTFLVEQLNPQTNQYEVLGTKTIEVAWPTTNTASVSLSDIMAGIDELGVYTFRITEVDGDTVGMTYSNQISTFQVNVVDPELDGIPTMEVVALTNTTVTESNDTFTVTANFTNIYYVGSTHVDVNIHKNFINNTGVDMPITNFQFGLYSDPACTQLVQIVDGEHLTVYAGPLGNAVIRIPVTNVSQNGAVYYLKEIVPATTVAGMDYSDAIYQVTLTVEAVEDGGNATLTAQAAIELYAGEGQINGNEVTFKNTYTLKPVSVEIDGNKSYIRGYDNTPITMEGGEFTFELWSVNADYTENQLLGTVTNEADGSFQFSGLSALTYTSVGNYVYILRERIGDNTEITYDTLDYYVVVTVTQGEGDTLVASVTYMEEGSTAATAQAQFRNVYNVSGTAQTVIRGHKTLTVILGQKSLTGNDFVFGLYEGTDTSAAPIATTTNRINGDFAFDAITYTAADVGKTFVYTVKEIVPNGAVQNADGSFTYNGVTYSSASFQVEVTVTDNGDGTIRADQTVIGGNIAFENFYKATPATVTFSGTKNLSGRDLEEGEFTFHLYETGADFVISGDPIETTNSASGAFSFGTKSYTTPGTYYYVVREYIPGVDAEDRLGGVHYDAGVYQITVQVSDGGNGQMTAITTINRPGSNRTDLSFRNTYTTQDAQLILEAQKIYNKPLQGDDFTFVLEGEIDGVKIEQSKTNDADGKVVFDQLTFTQAGVYTLTVIEKGEFLWIEYDKTVYTVTVTVEDNGNGQLVATIQYSANGGNVNDITFRNIYKIVEDAEVTLGGDKYYLGDELTAGKFSFGLYEDADCTKLIGQAVPNTVETENLGHFTFPTIQYTEIHYDDLPITHTYYIREILPEGVETVTNDDGSISYVLDGVFYDASVYEVKVILTDNGTGGVNVQTLVNGVENGAIAFTNSYNILSGTEVVLQGSKILHGKDNQTFTFGLYDSEGNELGTATNGADGTFAFAPIAYTAEDAGQTFTYTVREIIPADAVNNVFEGITYDDTVYTVTVEVQDNGSGGLQQVVTITGGDTNAIVFNNYYNVTGEAVVTIDGMKHYRNANGATLDVAEGAFSFALYQDSELIATATTAAGGAFQFQLTYGPEDVGNTYTYQLRETAGEAGYITYDGRVRTVVVEVSDDGIGGITATVTVDGEDTNAVTFTNTYTNNGTGTVALGGEKLYFNAALNGYIGVPAGAFTFQLKDASGAVLQEVTNLENGSFAFDPIQYTADDIGKTFRYTVVERNDGLSYIDYDGTVYEVIVEVQDNGEGGLKITKQILDSNGNEVQNISFRNVYNVTGEAMVELLGIKQYLDAQGRNLTRVPAGMFHFKITGPDGYSELVTNVEGGSFDFSPLRFTAEDIGKSFTYTIEEVAGDKDYITYDTTKHTVVITVSDNGEGGLKITQTLDGQEVAYIVATFANIYNVIADGGIEIVGNKTYTDSNTGEAKAMEAGQFTFRLTGHGLDLTTTNDENGNFKFEIAYTAEDIGKEYTYTVSEVAGDKAYISYDDALFQVKVKIEDDGEGGLKITKTLVNGDINFQNFYNTIATGSVTVGGIKHYLNGHTQDTLPIPAGMFSFRISGNGVDETVSCVAGGGFRFSELTYDKTDIGKTYLYTIEEIAGDIAYITYDTAKYTLKVTVEDDGEGGLKITKQLLDSEGNAIESIAFRNVYNVISGGQTELSGTKAYTDARTGEAKPIAAGQFAFRISGNGVDETVYCDANGNFTFAPLTYTAEDVGKTFTYTVEEIAGDTAYITYDTAKYTLEVTVEDNGEGGLQITQKLLGGDGKQVESLAFHNAYNVIGEGQVDITGIKFYEGRDLVGNDFSFTLSQNGQVLQTVQNAADGSFAFAALQYTAADIGNTYTYIVKELRPDGAVLNADGVYELDGIIYDANIYTIQVTVEDDGQGGLKITKTVNGEAAEQIQVVFDNKYQISGTAVLEIPGTKTLTGRDMTDGEFTFGLYLNGELVSSATNVGGIFVLSAVYGAQDLGDYLYTVAEIKGDDVNITYDDTVYQVKVRVYDDGKGGVAVAYKIVDAAQILFENVYTPPVTPETGDTFPVTLFVSLMILSTFGIAAVMVCKKREEEEEIAA